MVVVVCNGLVGTGWWVSQHHVVTAGHVVGRAETCMVVKGSWSAQATVVAFEQPPRDLAVLQVQGDPPPHPVFPVSDKLPEVGDPAYVIGFPAAVWQLLGTPQAVSTDPRVLSFEIPWVGSASGVDLIEIGWTQPGNSGGPVVGEDGRVIGVVTMALSPSNTTQIYLFYATAATELIPLLEDHNIPYTTTGGIPAKPSSQAPERVLGISAAGGAIAGAVAAAAVTFLLSRRR